MLGVRLRRTECLLQECHAHSLGPADVTQGRQGPKLALDHLSEQGEPHRDDLAVLGKLGDRLIQKGVLVLGEIARPLRQVSVSDPEGRQHLPGMARIEKVDGYRILSFHEPDFQFPHEPGRRHPEIVSYHDDRLEVLTVALSQRGDQFRVLLTPLRMEPLLELVQDNQHLLPGAQHSSLPHECQGIDQPRLRRQIGTRRAQCFQQPRFRLLRARLDIDSQDVPRQQGQYACLDQRGLPTTRGPKDEPHSEGFVGISPFDMRLPEPNVVGQALPVSWSRQ